MTVKILTNLNALKACRAGEHVSFCARVLRFWTIGGLGMCLVGDELALTRVEIGDATVEESASYEFRDVLVREYPGGWHSASLVKGSQLVRLTEDVPVSQDEAYVERTYKILAGVQRKRGRQEGRVAPWRHPADIANEGPENAT